MLPARLTYCPSISQLHYGLAFGVTLGEAPGATCGWQLHCEYSASVSASYFLTGLERHFTKRRVASRAGPLCNWPKEVTVRERGIVLAPIQSDLVIVTLVRVTARSQ